MSRQDDFDGMTADLRARGLIDEDGRITERGMSYTDDLLERLKYTVAGPAPQKMPVRWTRNQKGVFN